MRAHWFAPLFGAILLSSLAKAAEPESEILILGVARQSAPVASTVLDGPALARRGIGALDEAVLALPGVHMINDQDPGTNIVSIRGITTDRLQQAAIALAADGVPLGDTELFTAPLFDLDRIEALRGPQGARFGRNAAGGVIAIATRESGPGRLRLGIGNGNARVAEAALGGETWRAAGLWRAADGWIENETLGRVVDAEEVRAGRLRLRRAVGDWALRGKIEGYYEDGGAAWASSGDVTGDFGGRLVGAALTNPIGDFEGRAKRRWLQVSLAGERALAGGVLNVLLAHDDYRKSWVEELDYRPGPLTFFGAPLFPDGLQPIAQPTGLDIWTGEARFTREFGPLAVSLGAFRQDSQRDRVDDFGPLLFGADLTRYESDAALTGLFAGLAVSLPGSLLLEAQARHDHERRTQIALNETTGAQIDRREESFSRAQPRLALAWSPTADLTLYASYGEAFRTGGFNPIPPPGAVWEAAFAPEIARSREAGLRWRRGGASAEAAIFATDLSNYQNYTFLDGQSVTLSVDEVTIAGGEVIAGLGGAQGPWTWRLDWFWALADAEIDRFTAPDPIVPGGLRDYSGRQAPNIPAWTGQASGSLARGPFAAFLALNATGETFFEIDNALRSPPKTWLDARLSAQAGGWTVSLWAQNLTDERWAISAFGQGMLPLLQGLGPGGPFDTFTINRGRRFGLELVKDLP